MNTMRSSRHTGWLVMPAAAVVALMMIAAQPRAGAAATTAFTLTAAGDTIHACFVPNSGTVYRIKTAKAPTNCTKSSHIAFSWQEDNNLDRSRVVQGGFGGSIGGSALPRCAADEIATGGGYRITSPSDPAGLRVMENGPIVDTFTRRATGWIAALRANEIINATVYVICAPI